MTSTKLRLAALAAIAAFGLPGAASAQSAVGTQWDVGPMTPYAGLFPDGFYNVNVMPLRPPSSVVEPLVDRPWTAATSMLFGAGGPFGYNIVGNTFFGNERYGTDGCASLVDTPEHQTYGGAGIGFKTVPATYTCRITQAPVVDMQWVRDNLDAGGYAYEISYPFSDHGNGRAIVTWIKACWMNLPAHGWIPMYCYRGLARLEGAGWQDQYTPRSVTIQSTAVGPTVKTYQHGTPEGDRIAGYAEPYRSTSFVHLMWFTGLANPGVGYYDPYGHRSILQDDWLSGTPTPPPPPVQVSVPLAPPPAPPPAGSANPTNSGGPGAASGAGTGSNVAHDDAGAAFQWEAYCRSPNPDGSKRPSGWIDNCLATRH